MKIISSLLVNNKTELYCYKHTLFNYCPTETIQFKIKVFKYDLHDPANSQSRLVVDCPLNNTNNSFTDIESCNVGAEGFSIVLTDTDGEKLTLELDYDFSESLNNELETKKSSSKGLRDYFFYY